MRILLLSFFLTACGGTSDKDDTGGGGGGGGGTGMDVDSADDWWTTDDTGKDDDDDDNDDEHVGWLGFHFPGSEFASISYTDEGCSLKYELSVASADEDCEECEFASWFTVTGSSFEEEENCPSSVYLDDGLVFGFGQGPDVIYEEDGFTIYSLYWGSEGEWVLSEGGFSLMIEDEEGTPVWMFGTGPAADDHLGWLGGYSPETGEAAVSYNDEGCYVEYAVTLTPVPDEEACSICQFAYWFAYTPVETEKTDTTSCPPSVIKEEGDVDGLGHGTTSLGSGYYSLAFFDVASESWVELPSGFSYYESGDEAFWWFGLGPVDE